MSTGKMQLRVTWQGVQGTAYLLDLPEVLIGRGGDAQIDLATNKLASRSHAVVARTLRGHLVEDMSTRNGTRVNGKPVKRHHLEPGDHIMIGEHELVYGPAATDAMSLSARFSGWNAHTTVISSVDELDRVAAIMKRVRGTHIEVRTPEIVEILALDEGARVRIGSDPRCEVPIPKSGLFDKGVAAHIAQDEEGWVLVPRSARGKQLIVEGEALSSIVVLENEDVIELPDLELSITFFQRQKLE